MISKLGWGKPLKRPIMWEWLSKLLYINLVEYYVVFKNDRYVDC